ncbi:MAG: hypothetical protein RLZZ602_1535 [Pseudomonadota bacterium]
MLDKNVPQPWQGQTTLVFALAAVAIGLGNLFRLPWLLGEHGGAPFFLAYLSTLMLVTVPAMVAEVMLGSHGRGSPLGAMRWASDQSGRSIYWSWLGVVQAIAAMLLASQLLVLTVWLFDRAVVLNTGILASASTIDIAENFTTMIELAQPQWLKALCLLCALALLLAMGSQYALGFMAWLILPALAVALMGLLDYSLAKGALKPAGEYLFAQRYRDFDLEAALAGMGSAFFTLGAGLGIGLSFGARTPRRLTLLRSVMAAAVIDTTFAVTLAVVIVPLLFATNTAISEGLSLVFVAIPYAFSNLPEGEVYGALFFGFAALSGAATILALMEPGVMILRREVGLSRWLAASLLALMVFLMAGLSRFGPEWIKLALGAASQYLVVVGLLGIAVFVGWIVPRPIIRGELYREPRWLFALWWTMVRFVAPSAALFWLLRSSFLFE